MAGKRATELRTRSVDELTQHLLDLRKESFNLRFQQAGGQLDNTTRMRDVRRDIARTKFILAEKTRAGV
ncbi:MAG: 50S ribosomal protein L29 [Alphaproteobacteria bacterium]|nr:50S ribosomal protein L29 [Alphaproteobacteria bacterium]